MSFQDKLKPLPTGTTSAGFQSKLVPLAKPQEPDFMHKAGSVLDAIFGGGAVGELIGARNVQGDIRRGKYDPTIDYSKLTPEQVARFKEKGIPTTIEEFRKEQEGQVDVPSAGKVAGSAIQSAALFFPAGRAATAATKGLTNLGLKTGAGFLGNVASGLAGGYTFDVGLNLADGKTGMEALKPGAITAIGGALPGVAPLAKGAIRVGAETLGVSTGVGYGAIKELFNASVKGGEAKKAALDALRKNTTPEQVVEEATNALNSIKNARRTDYVRSLGKLAESTVQHDIAPIVEAVQSNLGKFGVTLGENGIIDFSRSPIRFNVQAQKDIQQIVDTMKTFGSREGDRTVIGLDSLKRAFGDLYTPSGEARAFVADVQNAVRDVLNKVDGYQAMSEAYTTKTRLINDISKALSIGGRSNIDTAFRKLSTVLRTNNEERRVLVEELNALTDGRLVPMIAGQQMSELLPRGLARQIEGFGALGSIMAGMGPTVLKMALFASPRVVAEMINALGIGVRGAKLLINALGLKGLKFPGDAALDSKTGQRIIKEVKNSIKNPSVGLSIKDVSTEADRLRAAESKLLKSNTDPKTGELLNPEEGMVFYHGTTPENKASILQNGINTHLNKKGYAEQPGAFYIGGENEAKMYTQDSLVGVRVKPGTKVKALQMRDKLWADTLGKSTSANETAAALDDLRRMGYDIVNEGDEIIVLNPIKFDVFDPSVIDAKVVGTLEKNKGYGYTFKKKM